MNTEAQQTIQKLNEVRSLLVAMDNLNQKELKMRQNFRKPQAIPAAPSQITPTAAPKKHWDECRPIVWIGAFILLTLLLAWLDIGRQMEEGKKLYEGAIINDKFDWSINWEARGGESAEYPGYQGPVKPYTRAEAFMHALFPGALFESAEFFAVLFVIVFVLRIGRKRRDKEEIEQNKIRARNHEAVANINRDIEINNQRVQAEIENIHKRKQMISKEFVTGVGVRFPKEYVYLDAVNYFIHELEIGTASTLPEAIKNYREHLFHVTVIDAMNEMNDRMQIMIDNQAVMIRKQDALIRQQIIGNVISCATYAETQKIGRDINQMKENSNWAAYYANGGSWDSK